MKKLSIIVPVYKVGDYLVQSVDSILNQKYTNIEVILVDDGSPDECPAICDKYKEIDDRIIVIHKKNGGLSSARNAGLKIATGEFIAFVDSDDWVDVDMYYELIRCAENNDLDMVTCGINYIYSDKVIPSCNNTKVLTIFDGQEYPLLITSNENNIRIEVWNKIYSRELINEIYFKEGQIYEDIYFSRIISSKIKKFGFYDQPMYNYRVNRPGSTNSFFDERKFSYFEEYRTYIDDLRSRKIYLPADIMEKHCAEMAVNIYVTIYFSSKNAQYLKRSVDYFNSFYKNRKNNKKLNNSFKIKLFSFSRFLYIRLWRFRDLLVSRK